MNQPVLEIRNLSVSFPSDAGMTSAIRDLSLTIGQGEIVAVVGESGCGKSVLCRTILGLLPPAALIRSGSIRLGASGQDLLRLSDRELCRLRGAQIAMVFQDPMTSLDPSCTIGAQIAEAIRVGRPGLSARQIRDRVVQLMTDVGIDRARQRYDSYPWMLSGGMRQRCVLAMALSRDPKLLIADEPTTALDVTVQKGILELLMRLRDERNLSILFISHDMSVVGQIADTVNVMYAGRIVETGTAAEVLDQPAHPYTKGLLRCLPAFAKEGRLQPIPGLPPVLAEDFEGDAFAPRNSYALEIDYLQTPPFFRITSTHRAATWLLDPRAPRVPEGAGAMEGEPAEAPGRNPSEAPESNSAAVPGRNPNAAFGGDAPAGAKLSGKDQGQHDGDGSQSSNPTAPLLEVKGVSRSFRIGRHAVLEAVKDVSFDIAPGQVFALVGESGSGKTTLARCILGMLRPDQGSICYDGVDMVGLKGRICRARQIQFISQDPGAALNPRMTVRDIIGEPLRIHRICGSTREREERIRSMLQEVHLDLHLLDRYPPELSGGQKQRVSIARAYITDPRLLVADEPLASLDVSIQAQIVELFQSLREKHHAAMLFISHDLPLVEMLSDRVGVMYRGRLVETGEAQALFQNPQHPYTRRLLAARPGWPRAADLRGASHKLSQPITAHSDDL